MLNLVVKYAREHLDVDPRFAPKWVRWAIVCDPQGQFLGVMELGDPSQRRNRGQRFGKCPDLPSFVVAGGTKGERRCHFLVETAQVVALHGVAADDEKARRKHLYFVDLLREASQAMPELGLLAQTLEDETALASIRAQLEQRKAGGTDRVTLCINDDFPVESEAWHAWWLGFHSRLTSAKRVKGTMRCYVTGQLASPVLRHPKVRGVARRAGGSAMDALVCFDKAAFASYGLEASANAAVSQYAVAAYKAAFERLLEQSSHVLAGAQIVYWFARPLARDDDPLEWLQGAQDQEELWAQKRAAEVLEALESGRRPELLSNYYYALALSGAHRRIMIRDWMEGQFQNLVGNVKAWFDDLQIVRRDGAGMTGPPKFMAVLGALVRELNELPPSLVARIWRVAVNREAIPYAALAMAVARARGDVLADQAPNHARMGLMKAYHLRKKGGSPIMPSLNEDHPHPAYHCGRLMAVYAALQHAAQGDVGAGVVQRYYAAGSATPGLILGRLSRLSTFHLGKLQGDRPKLAGWFENKLAEIWARIEDKPPTTLTLEEQSLFALGYYQQIAADRAKRPETVQEDEDTKEEGNDG